MAPTAIHEHAEDEPPWGSTPLTPCGSGGYRLHIGYYCLNSGYCLRAAAADEEQGGTYRAPRACGGRAALGEHPSHSLR